jgi:uncharacterized protein YecE (DUF72 family)
MCAVHVGTAGWSIPRASAHYFEGEGTHLARYARGFSGAEINSSFYRPHAASTYARWAASTPAGFRFAVKLPKLITHDRQLRRSRVAFERFLAETSGLGDRRGPLLVQLPPSFAFEARAAARFFDMVRSRYDGGLACEPRHGTWFEPGADALMRHHAVARVAADPVVTGGSPAPGGWSGLVYFRLHGSPRMYWSRYDATHLARLAAIVRQIAESAVVWCIFDNTASGAAAENAWELRQLLGREA